MAEETEEPGKTPSPDPVAMAIAFGAAAQNERIAGKAEAYLDVQTNVGRAQEQVLKLQAADLEREDRLRHWALVVHHLGDVMRVTFELTFAAVAVIVLIALAATIWSAAHDDGLVIEAFKVPPDMAQKGLTGDVVASQLLDRLTDMQAHTDSSRAPGSYSSDWGNDIKIEIPNTGISIGEAYRYLAGWLGHQTHISGEVYRTEKGIVLTVRTSGDSGARFEGNDADLNALVGKAAESVYRRTQPFRYAVYVSTQGRNALAESVLSDLASNGADSEKPWAYTLWGEFEIGDNDLPNALDHARRAAALAPELPLVTNNLGQIEADAGHDERELAEARAALKSLEGDGARLVTASAAVEMGQQNRETIDEELGDFSGAVRDTERLLDSPDFEGSHLVASYMQAADLALLHDVRGAHRVLGARTDVEMEQDTFGAYGWNSANYVPPQFMAFAQSGDWRAARMSLQAALDSPAGRNIASLIGNRTQLEPWLALAEAKSGDGPAALRQIGKSPLDCYLCLRMRGEIDATAGNWGGAAYWFARAVAAAPSIPFAYTQWGSMLLAKGDLDGAIAKFREANLKSPHFADPLEMWGEALIAKNRSDLALAKFTEAAKYAPNWGRLHLEWGESLFWAGDKTGAAKQFAGASQLDLTSSERSEFARMRGLHG
jgi:tetratricopeptide (TPR) repeat protein